jgi:hypothetical protein
MTAKELEEYYIQHGIDPLTLGANQNDTDLVLW